MNIDFGQLVKTHMKVYEAAHAEGYKAGFADGIKEAQKIVEATLGPLMKKQA